MLLNISPVIRGMNLILLNYQVTLHRDAYLLDSNVASVTEKISKKYLAK
jgi:hypothetical protein